MMLRRFSLAATLAAVVLLCGARAALAVCTSGIAIDSVCMVQGDLRGVLQINAGSVNTVYSVLLDGGRGSAGWQITGLTASGATLTPVWSDDGTTWNSGAVIAGGAPVSTLVADGAVAQDAVHHVAVGYKVTAAGSGTISAAYTVSVNAADPMVRNALGSQSDAAWSGAGNGSVVATLKTIAKSNQPTTIGYVAQSSLLLTTTVSTSSTQITNAGAAVNALTICTSPTATGNVWLNLAGAAAVVGQGLPVYAYGGCTPIKPLPSAAIYGIADGGSGVTISAAGD